MAHFAELDGDNKVLRVCVVDNAHVPSDKHADGETINYRSNHSYDITSTEFEAGEKIHELGQCNSCHFYGKVFPPGADYSHPHLSQQ